MNRNSIADIKEIDCCGCAACSQKCPTKSIQMQENDRGFLIPQVDLNSCINCGLCIQVCPERNEVITQPVLETYVAVSTNGDLIKESTSGGVFGELCKQIIAEEGVVYGCGWENNQASHIRIARIDELRKIQKSKYVQSNTLNTFKEVFSDLNAGKKVLYSGTACQVAGLQTFLGRQYDNLIAVEVACHGVPSPGLYAKYCEWLEKRYRSSIKEFTFRSKRFHKRGEHYKFTVEFANGRLKSFFSWSDPYYGAFLEGSTLRETCYHCKYKSLEQVGDILLADYWGVEKEHPSFPFKNGASAVLIVTEKGKRLFEKISKSLISQKSTLSQVVDHNKSIISSVSLSQKKQYGCSTMSSTQLFRNLKPAFSPRKILRRFVPERLKNTMKRIRINTKKTR